MNIIQHNPDALAREWGHIIRFLNTAGSDLAKWMAARRLKRIWEQLHPQTKQGAAPKKGKDLGMRSFPPAFVDQAAIDTGISRATLSRWTKIAEDLEKVLSEQRLEALLGSRIANNPKGILVKLSKMTSRAQAEDVIGIYREGAGETTALKALRTYLDVQAMRDAAPETSEDEDEGDGAPADLQVPFTCAVGQTIEVEVDGRPVRISIVAADDARATGTLNVEAAASRASNAITRQTWVADITRALREVPNITIHPVEVLLPRRCPECKGTTFYTGGDCVRCRPLADWPTATSIAMELGYRYVALWGLDPEDKKAKARARKQLARNEEIESRVAARLEERKREIMDADPRMRPGANYRRSERNLRHPRTIVRVTTPRGEIQIVLWERGDDLNTSYAREPARPVLDIGSSEKFLLDCSNPFDSRYMFRAAVRQMVVAGKPHRDLPHYWSCPPKPWVMSCRAAGHGSAAAEDEGGGGMGVELDAADCDESAATAPATPHGGKVPFSSRVGFAATSARTAAERRRRASAVAPEPTPLAAVVPESEAAPVPGEPELVNVATVPEGQSTSTDVEPKQTLADVGTALTPVATAPVIDSAPPTVAAPSKGPLKGNERRVQLDLT